MPRGLSNDADLILHFLFPSFHQIWKISISISIWLFMSVSEMIFNLVSFFRKMHCGFGGEETKFITFSSSLSLSLSFSFSFTLSLFLFFFLSFFHSFGLCVCVCVCVCVKDREREGEGEREDLKIPKQLILNQIVYLFWNFEKKNWKLEIENDTYQRNEVSSIVSDYFYSTIKITSVYVSFI